MVFRLLADLVVVVHLAFILFVAAGGLLVWRWPRLVRWHLPAVAWGIAIITIGFTCPLTPLEHYLRARSGEQGHDGGFVDRYVEGVIYPGGLTPLVRALIATVVVVGYAGALHRGSKPRTVPASSGRSVRSRVDDG
jgi:Protein of Unknown function (DUF2784)